MPLLLIPALLLAVLALWALLLPIALVQRYRLGKRQRRAQPWAVSANAWLLLVSAGVFVAAAWLSSLWIQGAISHALGGLALGIVLGIVGLWTTRFEHRGGTLHYTPNAALVLLLATVVALRIGLGLWQVVAHWRRDGQLPALLADHAGLFVAGGLLLGYALAYAWGLKRRLG